MFRNKEKGEKKEGKRKPSTKPKKKKGGRDKSTDDRGKDQKPEQKKRGKSGRPTHHDGSKRKKKGSILRTGTTQTWPGKKNRNGKERIVGSRIITRSISEGL